MPRLNHGLRGPVLGYPSHRVVPKDLRLPTDMEEVDPVDLSESEGQVRGVRSGERDAHSALITNRPSVVGQ